MSEARLGFAIDSSPAANAASDLDKLTSAAARTEQATEKASVSATKASRSFGDISPALERIIQGIDGLNKTSQAIENRLDAMSKAATMAAATTVKLGQAANDAGRGIDNLADKIKKGADAGRSFGDQAQHVVAFRNEVDRLTAKYQPLQTAAKAYENSISDIQRAQKLGIITSQQMTEEINKEAAAYKRLNEVPAVNPSAGHGGRNGLSEGNRRFIARDVGFQAQDVVATAIGGLGPRQIAFQQGPQIAGALQGLSAKEAGGALLSGVTSLISPVSILSIGLTGLAAAGIQAFMNTATAAKSLDDVLKDNADSLALVKDRYGELADVKVAVGSVAGNGFIVSQARTQFDEMQKTMKSQMGDYLGQVNATGITNTFASNGMSSLEKLQGFGATQKDFAGPISALLERVKGGQSGLEGFNKDVEDLYNKLVLVSKNPEDLRLTADSVEALAKSSFDVSGKFAPFADAINMLKVAGVSGLVKFNDEAKKIGENEGIQKTADELISKGKSIIELAQQAELLRVTLNTIDKEDTRPGLADRNGLQAYVARRGVGIQNVDDKFNADQQMARARTNQQRLDAVAAQARAARPSKSDEDGGVDARVDRAVKAEQVRQEVQLADAVRDRSMALTTAIRGQQQDISLVGRTGAAAESSRKEFELMGQIRAEAAKRGIEGEENIIAAYAKEIPVIKAMAAEYGRLAEVRARAQLSSDLSFQSDQFSRTPEQRAIADRLKAAGLPIDFTSKSAKDISDANNRDTNQTLGYNREGTSAQLAGIRARTDAERVAAARSAASAQHNSSEPDPLRQQRIDSAGQVAQAQIDKERSDAARDRSLSLDRMLASQKEELSLVGQTGGAAEGLRKQFELIAALQAEAAKNGGIVSPDEVARIKEATAAYGKMVDTINLAKLNDDLDFNDRQFGRTAQQQQIAATLRQSGQPEDLNSPVAERLKQQDDRAQYKSQIDQFSNNLASNIVQSGGKIGKAFGETFMSSLQESATKQLAKVLDELFTSLLTGKSGGGASGVGSLGAIGGSLFGSPANSNSATGSGIASGAGGAVDKAMSLLGKNETSNTGDINSFLKAGGVDINAAQTAWCAGFVNSSLNQVGVDGTGSQTANSFLNWGTKIDPSKVLKGDVLVQNRGLGADQQGGHVGFATGATRMSGTSEQLQMLSGNSGNAVKASWVDASSVQARRAADSLDKLTTSSTTAGQGLGKLGQLSSSFFPAAPAGGVAGGGGSWLSLLSGSIFSGSGQLAKSGGIGLFASGTDSAPGGMAIVGEKGPELINLPKGSQVIPNHKLGSMAANSNQPASGGPTQLHVHLNGANGDDHVRTLVQQGVGQALSDYNTSMAQGNFGTLQARYTAEKAD